MTNESKKKWYLDTEQWSSGSVFNLDFIESIGCVISAFLTTCFLIGACVVSKNVGNHYNLSENTMFWGGGSVVLILTGLFTYGCIKLLNSVHSFFRKRNY